MKTPSINYSVEPWITNGESIKYTTNIFKVLKREMEIKSEGYKHTFNILDCPDWVNVISLTPENEIILVEQYRFGTEKHSLEPAGGVCDPGEAPLESAKRELLEETGYSTEEWYSLGKVASNPAMQTNYTHTFLAKNCVKTNNQRLDDAERIKVHTMPLVNFLDLVGRGEIDHSLMVAAIAKFLLSEYS